MINVYINAESHWIYHRHVTIKLVLELTLLDIGRSFLTTSNTSLLRNGWRYGPFADIPYSLFSSLIDQLISFTDLIAAIVSAA